MATVRSIGLFPFCIRPAGTYPSSVKMEVSQDLALSLWWRVKKWNVDSASLTIMPEGQPSYELTMPIGEMRGGLASEKDLACPHTRKFSVFPGGPDFGQVISLRIQPSAQRGNYDLIRMDVNVSAGGGPFSTVWFRGDGGSYPNEIGTCTLTSAAGSKSFALGRENESAVSASVEISAIEYWPYDPEDGGGPIYDSDTGEQLREWPSA